MVERILLLEDDTSTRLAMTYLLTGAGYKVFAYATAEDAEPHLHAGDVDFLILDVRLPGRFGHHFGREYHHKWPATPILFATAEYDCSDVLAAVPPACILRKPFDINALLSHLGKASPRAAQRPARKASSGGAM